MYRGKTLGSGFDQYLENSAHPRGVRVSYSVRDPQLDKALLHVMDEVQTRFDEGQRYVLTKKRRSNFRVSESMEHPDWEYVARTTPVGERKGCTAQVLQNHNVVVGIVDVKWNRSSATDFGVFVVTPRDRFARYIHTRDSKKNVHTGSANHDALAVMKELMTELEEAA
jgi:hypothetical protein